MIDLDKPTTSTAPPSKPKRPGALIAVAVSVVGLLLTVLGLTSMDSPLTGADRTEQTSAVDTSSDTASAVVEATQTQTTAQSSVVESSAVVLTDVSDIAGQVVDSVVTVESIGSFRGRELVVGTGSGVIAGDSGIIVTNAHVVETANSIVVVLADGTEYPGTILEIDMENDLAALQIDATGLQPVQLGSTADLAVGDGVIAVGYPLGLEGAPSVSTGIISALDRSLSESDVSLTGVIQTDAAITEGSSGGALFDSSGELIGITTAVGVSSVGIEGIAFAIPVESILENLSALAGI